MVYNSINCSKLHACYIKYITYINIKLILIPEFIHFCYPVTSGNILLYKRGVYLSLCLTFALHCIFQKLVTMETQEFETNPEKNNII